MEEREVPQPRPWLDGIAGGDLPKLIESDAAVIRVIAGPGSGKTLAIERRIRCLIEGRNVQPGKIFVGAFNREIARQLSVSVAHAEAKVEVSTLHFTVAVYTIALANFALAGLAVGLGSLYPNFEEDNPARIVSGMGGTLNFLLSVGYITLLIGSQMLILQWHAMRDAATPTNDFAIALAILLTFDTLLSICAALLPMRLGLRNLLQTEF